MRSPDWRYSPPPRIPPTRREPLPSTLDLHLLFSMIRPWALTDSIAAMADARNNPYLRDAVMTATPEQLQLMLYDGAIRYALKGREALENDHFEEAFEVLTRAQKIIIEMHNGLNHEVNPELCARVASIYNFLYRKLIDASVERKPEFIDDALKVLRIERETWQILVDKVNKVRDSDPTRNAPAEAPASHVQEQVSFTAEA